MSNMDLSRFLRNDAAEQATTELVVCTPASLKKHFVIPEPTKSLLWITFEDVSKIASPMAIKMTISVSTGGIETHVDDGHNFFGEPSLIWTKLSVEENDELEKEPMYYPAYSRLSPKQRYQYLSWLRDITQPTNLSYVFLYYYGLERHLLIGNFDSAVSEILRLLQHHDRGTFRVYAQEALIVATFHRKRFDLLEQYSFIRGHVSNESLLVRKALGKGVEAKDLMELASQVGFKNHRYIKLRPLDFEQALQSKITTFEAEYGPLLDIVPAEDMHYERSSVFANYSLPEPVRAIQIPQLVTDHRFQAVALQLLVNAHESLKSRK